MNLANNSMPDAQQLETENNALQQRIAELERVVAERDYDQRLHDVLYRLSELTWSAHDMSELYKAIHVLMSEHIYAENLFIAVFDKNLERLHIPYYVDVADDFFWLDTKPDFVDYKNSMTGYVLGKGEPLLVNRAQVTEMQAQGLFKVFGPMMESWLGVPFRYQNQVLGAIVVQSYDPQYTYTTREQALLTFVSQQIALAIVRKHQEQELIQARDHLEEQINARTKELRKTNHVLEKEIQEREKVERLQAVLYRIAKLSSSEIELDSFFSEIHEAISQLLYAYNFYVALLDDDNVIQFAYVVDQWAEGFTPRRYDPNSSDGGLTDMVLSQGKTILFSQQDPADAILLAHGRGRVPHSWLGAPLTRDGASVGVLVVQSYTHEVNYVQADKSLLTFVAQHISTALQRRQDAERLTQAHAELKTVNDELEQRIQARTHELSSANHRLQQMLEERKAIEARLAHAASHDSLTGLPNRVMLLDRLQNAINRGLRLPQASYALLFLDLDRFKIVNDSLGHLMGDQLLQHVADRLRECVRPGDTVARLGGDEFCILLVDLDTMDTAAKVASRILNALAEVIIINEQRIVASTSIGIALGTHNYHSPEAVLRDADIAMYQAKNLGKAQYAIFTPDMHDYALTRMNLENELRHAVKQNDIEVYYQPIVNLTTGKVVSVEALARWSYPGVGSVNPEEFIAIAEETGLIHEMGMQILQQALQALAQWRELQSDISVSVNLSPVQFNQAGLAERILAEVAVANIPAKHLRLEITENLFIYNYGDVHAVLDELNAHGIGIVMDDFGKGYSSLSYLRNLPLTGLKIDRAFTYEITEDKDNRSIVEAVNTLAENLGIQVVAEGVETEAHVVVLRELGVNLGQGYYFAKPCSAEELKSFLATSRPQQ